MTTVCQDKGVRYRFLLRTFICYVPLATCLLLWAWRATALPEAEKAALVVLGTLIWTPIEYLLHRFLLHYRPQQAALLRIVEPLHLGHHRHPRDEAKITVPVWGSLPIAGALLGLFRLVAGGWPVAALLMTGSMAGYLYYETVHFWIHCGGSRRRWLRGQRANHLCHHFEDQTRHFGVTTQWWDVVLGTGRRRSRQKVPLAYETIPRREKHLQAHEYKEGTA